MTRAVLTLSAAWSSSGFQTENVGSEPSRDKGNHSPKPPRAPVHAALARGGLDQGAYFTSERAHYEKFAAKGLDRTTTTSRPEKRVFLRLTDKGLEAKKGRPHRRRPAHYRPNEPMVLAEIATRQIKTGHCNGSLELNDLSPVQLCYSFQRKA